MKKVQYIVITLLLFSCSHKKLKEPAFVIEFGEHFELLGPSLNNEKLSKCDQRKSCLIKKEILIL